jgi:hypothetical protein
MLARWLPWPAPSCSQRELRYWQARDAPGTGTGFGLYFHSRVHHYRIVKHFAAWPITGVRMVFPILLALFCRGSKGAQNPYHT